MKDRAIAQAPASIANLAVGFDLLGLAFPAVHDRITAVRTNKAGVHLGTVSGLMTSLPCDVMENTALRGVHALLHALGNPFGVEIHIEKGIPKSAGMGGSASSSVASVLAVNALLDQPLARKDLFPFCLEGESASSNPPPRDNTAACLFGGLVMARPDDPTKVLSLPVPDGISAVLVHPELEIRTGESRAQLNPQVPQSMTIEVAGRMGAFVQACTVSDHELIAEVMRDIWIEPQRASGIAHFHEVQNAALDAGALSCSISGSGPSLFAWVPHTLVEAVQQAMMSVFNSHNIEAQGWSAPLDGSGAEMVE